MLKENLDPVIEKLLNNPKLKLVSERLIRNGLVQEDLGISEDARIYCAHSGDYYDE